jgi:hypothetical protein
MFKFSNTSKERLASCHPDLQKIMNAAIMYSDIDFGIAQGHRSVSEQQELYARGRTKPGNRVKHNYKPSMAVDVYAWVNGSARWRDTDLMYITGVVTVCAKQLKDAGEITHDIRFGSNWDRDGEFITDQTFQDLPHIELI